MTEPGIEEIVARWAQQPGAIINQHEIDRIIASWRARGAMIDAIHAVLDEHDGDDAVGRIRDVLYGGAEDKI